MARGRRGRRRRRRGRAKPCRPGVARAPRGRGAGPVPGSPRTRGRPPRGPGRRRGRAQGQRKRCQRRLLPGPENTLGRAAGREALAYPWRAPLEARHRSLAESRGRGKSERRRDISVVGNRGSNPRPPFDSGSNQCTRLSVVENLAKPPRTLCGTSKSSGVWNINT